MKTEDFHAAKENSIKELNIAIQTVLINDFPEETKKEFVDLGMKVAQQINIHRQGVYALLEGHDFTESYDPTSPRFHIGAPINIDLRRLHHGIITALTNVIAQSEAITSKITNEKHEAIPDDAKNGFDGVTENIIKGCRDMINIILREEEPGKSSDETEKNTEKETEIVPPLPAGTINHTLTQEDFDNNPELAGKNLKVGDKIEIEETTIAPPATVVDEPQTPSSPPPAVLSKEEIEKGNASEKKDPRKGPTKK